MTAHCVEFLLVKLYWRDWTSTQFTIRDLMFVKSL